MIDAGRVLVLRDWRRCARTAIIDPGLVGIRRRHELVEELARIGRDAVRRNHIAGERLFRHGVEYQGGDSREITCPQHRGRNQSCSTEGPRYLAARLPVEEEERLVLPVIEARQENGAAQIRSKLV